MASRAVLTQDFTASMWEALDERGLIKTTTVGVGKRAEIVHNVQFAELDKFLVHVLAVNPVTTTTEFEDHGLTMHAILHDHLGLPDDAALRDKADFNVAPLTGAADLVRSRLSVQFDKPVQKALNGEVGLWLIHTEFANPDTGTSINYWGATNTPDMVDRYGIVPELRRKVREQKRSTQHGLTMMRRVPEVSARIIAAQESQLAALQVARERTYQVAVAALDPSQRRELDAAIASHRTGYSGDKRVIELLGQIKEVEAFTGPKPSDAETVLRSALTGSTATPGDDAF